jgi:DNA-binding winged helix-turn-helix (wHTH) protein
LPAPTLHRFGSCVLDEARRSLTADGQEIRVQPRVFDLLCYLVRHRDRVVTKDELLDALWPGTVVVDNALQRVVSLARAALAPAGLSNAVRTYARHGYRFCLEGEGAAAQACDDDLVLAARQACERKDWDAACDAFVAADRHAPVAAADVEQWGRAAICAGRGPCATAALERQAAECEAKGDALGAARATAWALSTARMR